VKVKAFVEAFGKHHRVQEYLSQVQYSGQHIAHFQGLIGSSAAVVLAGIFYQQTESMLILVPETEEAEFLRSDLEHLLSANDVLLLPSSFKRPFDVDDVLTDAVQTRAEVIKQIATCSASIHCGVNPRSSG